MLHVIRGSLVPARAPSSIADAVMHCTQQSCAAAAGGTGFAIAGSTCLPGKELTGAGGPERLLAGCHPHLDVVSNDHRDAAMQHRQLQAHTPPCPSGSQAEVCLLHVVLITWIHIVHISVDDHKACTQSKQVTGKAVQLEAYTGCTRSRSAGRHTSWAGLPALQGGLSCSSHLAGPGACATLWLAHRGSRTNHAPETGTRAGGATRPGQTALRATSSLQAGIA